MSFLESFRVAIDALIANKMRAILTMLGVIIGVMSVIALVSIGQGVTADVTSQITGLGSNLLFVVSGKFDASGQGGNGGMPTKRLTPDDADLISKRSSLSEGAVGIIESMAKVKYKNHVQNVSLVGSNSQYPTVMDRPTETGRFFTESQVQAARRVTVIGKTTADRLFGSESPIGKRISISDQKFVVIGVMSEKGNFMGQDFDNGVWIPTPNATIISGESTISQIVVKAKNPDRVGDTKREIEAILSKKYSKDDFTVMTQGETLNIVQGVLGVMTLMLAGIASISLLVGGIGIMNIMLVSVTERTREIGIRKAVGARTYDIMMQFVIEAVILSLTGGTLGIIVGIGLSLIVDRWLPALITPWAVMLAFGFSAAVGIFFGVYPAWKAARLDPIEALRYE